MLYTNTSDKDSQSDPRVVSTYTLSVPRASAGHTRCHPPAVSFAYASPGTRAPPPARPLTMRRPVNYQAVKRQRGKIPWFLQPRTNSTTLCGHLTPILSAKLLNSRQNRMPLVFPDQSTIASEPASFVAFVCNCVCIHVMKRFLKLEQDTLKLQKTQPGILGRRNETT